MSTRLLRVIRTRLQSLWRMTCLRGVIIHLGRFVVLYDYDLYASPCICSIVYLYVYINMYVYMCICIYLCVYMCVVCVYTYMCICICVHVYTCIDLRVYTCIDLRVSFFFSSKIRSVCYVG